MGRVDKLSCIFDRHALAGPASCCICWGSVAAKHRNRALHLIRRLQGNNLARAVVGQVGASEVN